MADNIELRTVASTSETIKDRDESPSPASTPVDFSHMDSEQRDVLNAFDTPRPDPSPMMKKILTVLDCVSVVLIVADGVKNIWQNPCEEPTFGMRVYGGFLFTYFVLEMMFKISDQGFWRRGQSYLRNPWNVFDLLILVVEILDYILSGCGVHWRISQPMKPLRMISRVKPLKNLVTVILKILPKAMKIFCLFVFVIDIFSIVGVQLWAGQLRNRCFLGQNVSSIYNVSLSPHFVSEFGEREPFLCSAYSYGSQHCFDVPRLREDGQVCLLDPPGLPQKVTSPPLARMNHGDCVNWNTFYNVCRPDGPNPYMGVINFDNVGSAWITIFQVISLEGWTDIMYLVLDASSFWSFLFFIVVTGFGSFIILNTSTVVIASLFSESFVQSEEENLCFVLLRKLLHCTNDCLEDPWSRELEQTEGRQVERGVFFHFRHYNRLRVFVKGPFKWVMMVAMFLNIITMAMEHHDQSATWTQVLGVCDVVFTSVFVLEFVLKLLVYQGLYFVDLENLFDLAIMIISLCELGPIKGRKLSVLRSLRVLRLVKLLHFLPSLKRQMLVLEKAMTVSTSLCCFVFFFIYIFSIIGMNLFGCKFKSAEGEFIDDRKNFDSLVWAMVTVFQILTLDDWNIVLYNAIVSTSPAAAIYFVVLILFGNGVLLNFLVGIVVDSFQALPLEGEGEGDEAPAPPLENQPVNTEATTIPFPQEEVEQPQEGSETTDTTRHNTLLRRIRAVIRWCRDHEDWSLFVYSPTNKVRCFCRSVVTHKVFGWVMVAFIIISCITIAMERPAIGPNSTERLVLDIVSHVVTAVFMVEMLMKVIALGLIFGQGAYCSCPWNMMDGLLALTSQFDVFVVLLGSRKSFLGIRKVFRLLRVLRSFRLMQRTPRLKLALETLIASVKPMANIALICSLLFLVFAISGVQLFKGKFFYCDGEDLSNIKNKTDCLEAGYQWMLKKYNFDNLLQAFMTLFVTFSKDGWVSIMYDGLDGVEVDQQPVKNYNLWMLVYFISFVALGYFLLDMFIGVMVETFNHCRQKQRREDAGSPQTGPPAQNDELEEPEFSSHSTLRRMLILACRSRFLEITMTTIVVINIVLMGVEHHNQPKYVDQLTEYTFIIFTIILFIVVLMKIGAFGPVRFCKDCWNVLDIWVLFSSIICIVCIKIQMPDNFPFNPSVLRIFRTFQLTQVLKAEAIRTLLKTIVKTLIETGNICLLLSVFLFIYAALGVELFGKLDCSVEQPCYGLHRYSNFKDFPLALLTLYKICTGDNWSGILKDALQTCSPDDPTCSYNNAWAAPIYFFTFVILAQYFVMNLIVAAIMLALEESLQKKVQSVQPSLNLAASSPGAVSPEEEGAEDTARRENPGEDNSRERGHLRRMQSQKDCFEVHRLEGDSP